MDTKRRLFFKGAGLVGAFAAGIAVSRAVKNSSMQEEINVEDISNLAPSSDHALRIAADNRTKKEKEEEILANSTKVGNFVIVPSMKETNAVAMSVGKDNRLWIKVNNEWKRVALEG